MTIFGIDGELLTKYKAGLPASAPEKEYDYRNGQLLVTATGRLNVALAVVDRTDAGPSVNYWELIVETMINEMPQT